ncbi:choline transporter-like protein 3 isoform X2 [Pezoporus flaviventris]|uniref:choline transporter-like protein 3 isoform X2 n=1 Tax=Pezoporus flaviventris TaxID=889875 RepID=UPI002AB1C72B|nr:choline transporter-like protein 3 isoform X2 [Pezoporus flaviventris]
MERRWGPQQDAGDGVSELREWRPVVYRKCTDALWLLLFFLYWAGLMFITGYAVMAGAAERLVLGYDSFGNVCGRKNTPVKGAPLSGRDMTNKKYVFFLNSCNLEMQNLKISSLSLCVSSCPQEQLNSLEDLQSFARNNGSCLCIYNLNISSYTLKPKAVELCPTLPVPPSKSFPLFNRCVPQNPECYSKYASVLISMVNEMDVFHRILSGILAGRDTVIGLSVLALAFSLILVLAFRFIRTVLVHTLIALVVFGMFFVSGVLWWLYYDYRNDPSTELETEKENVKFLLGYAIFSTIVTVVLLSLTLVLRKRLQFTTQLFRIVGKIIGRIPFLLFQPFWTFVILVVFWVFWVAVLLSLGTAVFKQFMTCCDIPSASTRLLTQRNKTNPPPHPVLSSISVLFCYHLGTAVKGSFLITILRIPRILLLYFYNILKQKESACAKCLFKCCFCCFWCQESCLRYFNQHAYTTTAINGTNFCTSAKDAVFVLAKNSAKLASISCFGDFILFLGKVFVVCFTVFGGLMAFNYHRELQAWVVPLLLVGFFACLISHSFLSVFEVTADAIFLCFAIDMETNDGSAERPYFVDQELLTFVSQSNKLTDEQKHRRPFQDNEDGTELQPMT